MSASPPNQGSPAIELRHDLRPGDFRTIVHLHGTIYAREYGFDGTFEAYVAGPLAEFARTCAHRDCIWLAEQNNHVVGCIAIVGASQDKAQLRWFLVDPSARGQGLGRWLLHEAVEFCKRQNYQSVFLWTVSALTAAARLYQSFGFRKVEEKPCRQWGVDVVEERYVLNLKNEDTRSACRPSVPYTAPSHEGGV